MYRFFGLNVEESNIVLSSEDMHHIVNVLRLGCEEFEVVFDGFVYRTHIESNKPLNVIWTNKTEIIPSKTKVFLGLSLIKGDKLELSLQKCTELGVDGFYLFESSRIIAKFSNENANKKIERFNKIVREAAQQSRRTTIPEVQYIGKMTNLFSYKKELNMVAYENAETASLKNIKDAKNYDSLIIIGPEGGFSEEEILLLKDNNFEVVSLGKNILRAETAPIYLASVISFLKELN